MWVPETLITKRMLSCPFADDDTPNQRLSQTLIRSRLAIGLRNVPVFNP